MSFAFLVAPLMPPRNVFMHRKMFKTGEHTAYGYLEPARPHVPKTQRKRTGERFTKPNHDS